jgi:hypothetical protein
MLIIGYPARDKRKVTSLDACPGRDEHKVTSLKGYPAGDKYKVTVISEYPRKNKRSVGDIQAAFFQDAKYPLVWGRGVPKLKEKRQI